MKLTKALPAAMMFWMAGATTFAMVSADKGPALFKRISTFNICEQIDPSCNTDNATNAETLWYFNTEGGGTKLVYTDAEGENLGFVDITDPAMPKADGTVPLGGEPTTVRVVGDYAVVGVNTSPDFVNPTGKLSVVDLASKTTVHEMELLGQPDAVDVSKDISTFPIYIAVAIENERDEDLGDGAPPQLPAGFLTVVTIPSEAALADPTSWTSKDIAMTGMEGCRFQEDPEPEYVAIHSDNKRVVVTLQENNCNVVVDMETGSVLGSFDAGAVVLEGIDIIEDGLILQEENVPSNSVTREAGGILREPDGVSWIGSTNYFATANEGDLDGGSRGWSIVDASTGEVVYDSGTSMEWETAKIGHYPDERSGNKGNEPENVFYESFPDFDTEYVFVLSERSSVVFVYTIDSSSMSPPSPELVQILPVGIGPEGITAIPSRNLVAIASEVDDRDSKLRSSIAVFELGSSETGIPEYPSLVSAARDGSDGPSIPFAALSGLTADSTDNSKLYTVEDSFYNKNRIMTIDTSSFPAVITAEQAITDLDGVLSKCLTEFDTGDAAIAQVDVSKVINDDNTINIDPEGISMVSTTGGFWVVSEGKGTIGDEAKPFATPNLLLELDDKANIVKCVVPDSSFQPQLRFGFEGVAEDGTMIAIALQRAWGEEPNPRIAVYNSVEKTWKYAFYPLDAAESLNGGWVGLSDIAPLGEGKFLVLERDNQGGPDAALKKIYSIDLGDYSWEDGTLLTKTLFMDLVESGVLNKTNGQIIEKVEGLTVTVGGDIWINTDNDGVDDSSGESLLANVGTYIGEEIDSGSGAHAKSFVVLATIGSCFAPLLMF